MAKPIRIGIEAQRLFRPRKHGMDVYAVELIRALQQVDRRNEYVIFAQPDEDIECINETANFEIVTVPTPSYPLWEQVTLPNLARKYKLDLLHCTANTAPLAAPCKTVLTLHDVIFMHQNAKPKGQAGNAYQRFGNQYRRWLVPIVARRANAVITVSGYQKTDISRTLGLPPQRITVTPNGVADAFRAPADAAFDRSVRDKHRLPERYFFFLGNTEPRKNLSGVLQAYAQLRQQLSEAPALVIKGITQDYLWQHLSKLQLHDIQNRIQLLTYLTPSELAVVYRQSTAFLFPSFSEGFGIPIVEAMAAGTPVITSNTTSMPEVSGGAALLVNPANTVALADAMRRLATNPALAENFRQLGRQQSERFSWVETAHQTLRVYEKTVNAQRLPHIPYLQRTDLQFFIHS